VVVESRAEPTFRSSQTHGNPRAIGSENLQGLGDSLHPVGQWIRFLQRGALLVNSTVDLSFRYTQCDYVRAMRAHYATVLHLKLDIAAALILAVLGVYLWSPPDSHWIGIVFMVISTLFALILITAFIIIPRLAFRHRPKLHDDYALSFSPDGIRFRTAHINSQLQWSLYSRALVDAHSYILYYGSNQFTVIPKRVFQSAEEQESFDVLLDEHVPKVVRRET
jgi:hypothetical protein